MDTVRLVNEPLEVQIHPVGDSALVVQLGRAGTDEVRIDSVLHAQFALQQAELPGVIEITTAFASVAVFYDPLRVGGNPDVMFASLEHHIRTALADGSAADPSATAEQRTIQIPVCYDPEFAFDLADVAQHSGLAAQEVIRRHSSADYRVGCVGFTPGFPYLVGLPAELATPRRATPRTSVPGGSVAIGGSQAGIYPLASPGGWHLIGRTPLRLFDASRETPSLLQAGDRVRFREILREEFQRIAAAEQETAVQAPANK